jgi:hypothetical protein
MLRGLHILTGGVLLGACLFEQDASVVRFWLLAASISGGAFLLTDLHATAAVLLEWRGLAVLIKLVLLALMFHMPALEIPVLVTVLFIGAVSSHLSRDVRHRRWLNIEGVTSDRRRG